METRDDAEADRAQTVSTEFPQVSTLNCRLSRCPFRCLSGSSDRHLSRSLNCLRCALLLPVFEGLESSFSLAFLVTCLSGPSNPLVQYRDPA